MNKEDMVKEQLLQSNQQRQKQQQMSIDISNNPDHVCPKCSNVMFLRVVVFKKLSILQRPDPSLKAYPVELFVCSRCGRVMDVHDLDDKDEPKEEKSSLVMP